MIQGNTVHAYSDAHYMILLLVDFMVNPLMAKQHIHGQREQRDIVVFCSHYGGTQNTILDA